MPNTKVVKVIKARFVLVGGVTAICLLLDDSAATKEYYWPISPVEHLEPSADGKNLYAGKKPHLVIKRNGKIDEVRIRAASCGGRLLASLVEAGFPEAALDRDDISVLEGLRLRIVEREIKTAFPKKPNCVWLVAEIIT